MGVDETVSRLHILSPELRLQPLELLKFIYGGYM